MADSLAKFIQEKNENLRQSQIEIVLEDIKNLFLEFSLTGVWQAQSISLEAFDQFCLKMGRLSGFELFMPVYERLDQIHDVILVTEVVACGGHAELINDLLNLNDLPLRLVATNINKRKLPVVDWLQDLPALIDVVDAQGPELLQSLRLVQAILSDSKVRKIHILSHAYDTVAISAIPERDPELNLFYHHCDHQPALGCNLPHLLHLDLHNIGFHRCRTEANLPDNRYLCLTSVRRNKLQTKHVREFARSGLKTLSCGGSHKLQSVPYHIRYQDLVLALLSRPNASHFHVGNLADAELQTIYQMMVTAEIPPERFVCLGDVPDLPAILHYLDIDLYLPTLPQSGGKAIIDVMSMGVPILAHHNARDRLNGSIDLIYPEALSWRTQAEFEKIIDEFNEAEWQRQSSAAYRYFQRYHSKEKFIEQLRQSGIDFGHADLPALKRWNPDLDQRVRYLSNS